MGKCPLVYNDEKRGFSAPLFYYHFLSALYFLQRCIRIVELSKLFYAPRFSLKFTKRIATSLSSALLQRKQQPITLPAAVCFRAIIPVNLSPPRSMPEHRGSGPEA